MLNDLQSEEALLLAQIEKFEQNEIPAIKKEMATKLYQDCPESYRDELTGLDTEITEFVDQLDDLRIQIRESERTLPQAKASTIHKLVETLA